MTTPVKALDDRFGYDGPAGNPPTDYLSRMLPRLYNEVHRVVDFLWPARCMLVAQQTLDLHYPAVPSLVVMHGAELMMENSWTVTQPDRVFKWKARHIQYVVKTWVSPVLWFRYQADQEAEWWSLEPMWPMAAWKASHLKGNSQPKTATVFRSNQTI